MDEFMDVRIQKTKLKIYQALETLLEESFLDDISVSQIIQTAEISRGGFYKNYKNKNELVDEIIESFAKMIQSNIQSYWDFPTDEYIYIMFKTLTNDETGRLFQLLLGSHGSIYTQQKIQSLLRNIANTYIIPRINLRFPNEAMRDYFSAFLTSNVITLVQEWLRRGKQESFSDLKQIVQSFLPINQLREH